MYYYMFVQKLRFLGYAIFIIHTLIKFVKGVEIELSGPWWTLVDPGGPLWTLVDLDGPWWTLVDPGGPCWTLVDPGEPWWTLVDIWVKFTKAGIYCV